MTDIATAPPWEPPDGPGRFTVVESATRVGFYKWYSMAAFEFIGTWVAVVGSDEIKATLGIHCADWAAAAEVWHRRLGTIRDRRPEDWTRPPTSDHAAWVADLGHVNLDDLEQPADSLCPLVGMYRVFVPRMVGALRAHRNGSARHSDLPTLRALDAVLPGLEDQLVVGEMMVQSLLSDGDDVQRAADRQASLEHALVLAGGLLGHDVPRNLGVPPSR